LLRIAIHLLPQIYANGTTFANFACPDAFFGVTLTKTIHNKKYET